jgi:hypothetical protein
VTVAKESKGTGDLKKRFQKEQDISTPILAVETSDMNQTISKFIPVCKGRDGKEMPVLAWDVQRGLFSLNDTGSAALEELVRREKPEALAEVSGDKNEVRKAIMREIAMSTKNPTEATEWFLKLPKRSKVFMLDANDFLDPNIVRGDVTVSRGIANLRDVYKTDMRMIVLLSESFNFPANLRNDVPVIVDPRPDAQEYEDIVLEVVKSAQASTPELKTPGAGELVKGVDALRGLTAYAAESVVARNLRKSGLDYGALWESKRVLIEKTPGLSVYRGNESFDTLGGYDNAKRMLKAVLNAKKPPRAVAFIDELEKAVGTGQDTSGVSQSMLGTMLSFMQDPAGFFGKNTKGEPAPGMIFVGPPGSGKSAAAKAAGNLVGIPTVQFDLTGMKGSLVGESERQLRAALKILSSISDDSVLFVATCNGLKNVPPELRRRFSEGVVFFDLPTPEERKQIWEIYLKKFEIADRDLPDDRGWTGAEIRNTCARAFNYGISLKEAAGFFVPIAQASGESIRNLRREAKGTLVSASYTGPYKGPEKDELVGGAVETQSLSSAVQRSMTVG